MNWIGRSEIEQIHGARRPETYVARAYRFSREHNGDTPQWASKLDDGQWQFDSDYIRQDARLNVESIGVTDAARVLGATRRAVQDWVDAGILPTLDSPAGRGERRRIDRKEFERQIPALKKRMETPAVIGRRIKSGKEVAQELLARIGRKEKEGTRRARRKKTAEDAGSGLSANELESSIRDIADARRETARARKAAGRRVRTAEAAEAKTIRSLEKKASALTKELKAVRDARQTAARQRIDAAKAERELAGAERRNAAEEERLKDLLDQRERRQKEDEVAGIEALFTAARQEHQREDEMENRAAAIAARLNNDLLDGTIDRIDAITVFTQLAEEAGVPREVRVKVRKKIFGR